VDRIHKDPGQRPRKPPSNVADHDFQAVGPALRILQLNVEGLSPAKRGIIQSLAEKHHVDVICLEKTHVKEDKSNRFTKLNGGLSHLHSADDAAIAWLTFYGS